MPREQLVKKDADVTVPDKNERKERIREQLGELNEKIYDLLHEGDILTTGYREYRKILEYNFPSKSEEDEKKKRESKEWVIFFDILSALSNVTSELVGLMEKRDTLEAEILSSGELVHIHYAREVLQAKNEKGEEVVKGLDRELRLRKYPYMDID